MCVKLLDLLEDAKHISEEEKSKTLFKVGDLLCFLNRYQDVYFLQRYQKATIEENAKATRLKKRLGLQADSEKEEDQSEDIDNNDNSNKRKDKKRRTS